MKNRLKIYSYVLFLANILLFAHSFVPHGHLHEQSLRSVVEKSVGEGVLNCGCSACSKFVSVVESISVPPTGDEEDCGCCSSRKGNCYISGGYIHHDTTENHNLLIVAIAPSVIVVPIPSPVVEDSYAEIPIEIPRQVAVRGCSLRAPPQLFS